MTHYEIATVIISSIALILSFTSIIFLILQLKNSKKNQIVGNDVHIIDINRQLISMGFKDKELFDILDGKKCKSKQKEKRYLQLWLNQINLIYLSYNCGTFDKNSWEPIKKDIQSFFKLPSMQKHWKKTKKFYSKELRKFIDSMILENFMEN